MSADRGERRGSRQSELDQEQAVIDLDQLIADREQARAYRDQEPLDTAQEALSRDARDLRVDGRTHAQRTTDLGLQQDRQDAHQAQLDQNQLAQGARQDVIDGQQAQLEAPSQTSTDGLAPDVAQAAKELQDALRRRAEDSLARAESARMRAVETLQRLDAAHHRQGRG
jgi:hypothetical protein